MSEPLKPEIEETEESSKKQRYVRIAVLVVVFFVAFALGILIGFFGMRKPESKEEDATGQPPQKGDTKAELQKRYEEMTRNHKKFQTTVAAEELQKNLK